MGPKALHTKRWATAIARRAGVRLSPVLDGGPDVAGTFSIADSAEGYELSAGTLSGSQRLHDTTGLSEARVAVNVSVAGSGSFGVAGDIEATASLGAVGLARSDWEPIEGDSWEWVSTGSATIGLAQLQVR
jgi:hypothetical protein